MASSNWKQTFAQTLDALDETDLLLIAGFAGFTIAAVRGCPDVPNQRANWSGRQMLQFGLATGMMAFLAFVAVQRGSGKALGAFGAACAVVGLAIYACVVRHEGGGEMADRPR